MKYLKKFNESKLGDELEEFCKEYLAYLTDERFECYVNSNSINSHITILDRNHGDGLPADFYWSEIADDFIPFLQILSERYVVAHDNIVLNNYKPVTIPNQYNKVFSVADVIDGKIPEYAICRSVNLQIDKKV